MERNTSVEISVEQLVERSADLKGELVEFAYSSRFSRQLNGLLRKAAGPHGMLDEGIAVSTVDHFALGYMLRDGGTVVEQFVQQRRPALVDDEARMLLGWRDVVEGCFEIGRIRDGAAELHNIIDDRTYQVRSNMGPDTFSRLRKGMFLVGRIVPLHPDVEDWLVSGHLVVYPKSAAPQLARAAVQTLTASPRLMRSNPDLMRRAWAVQADHRADFIAQFGCDMVVLPPAVAQEQIREHYRRQRDRVADRPRGGSRRTVDNAVTTDQLVQWPDDLLEADTVAVVYDEVEGLNYFIDFGRLEELFADPSLAGDRRNLSRLREYLRDDSVSPLAIRRLVQRHPDAADPVFRKLLSKPGFRWDRDGEKLLRSRKKAYFDSEPLPSISLIGHRLAELFRAG